MSILELKDVCYSYSAEKPVLRGMNCTFECGTLYALVGKSGAGKSTLLSLMAGLDLPDSGQVLFEGTPTGDMDLDEYRRRCVTIGREVQLLWQDTKEKVTALDVDEEFGLVVRRENGKIETVRTGEVSVRGLYGYVE